MIEIIFQKKQDARNVYQHFINKLKWMKNENLILLQEDRNKLFLSIHLCSNMQLRNIKSCFSDFITITKRDEWLRDILREKYYFHEQEEQDQIIDIIYSVLEGERGELVPFMKGLNINKEIDMAINEMFYDKISFSFDSFVMFRLKSYLNQLNQWIETAIDEYKMEQEYQVFIQTLREFLMNRNAKVNHLFLVMDENLTIYDAVFTEMKRSDLVKSIDRKLLVNHPVYVDSVIIAPLLSIAPERIFLYTDDPHQPLARTIINIFEERVKVKQISDFQLEKFSFLKKQNKNVQ